MGALVSTGGGASRPLRMRAVAGHAQVRPVTLQTSPGALPGLARARPLAALAAALLAPLLFAACIPEAGLALPAWQRVSRVPALEEGGAAAPVPGGALLEEAAPGPAAPERAAPLVLPAFLPAHALPAAGDLYLRTEVEVPASLRGIPLAFTIPLWESAAALAVQGMFVAPHAAPRAQRVARPQVWTLPPDLVDDQGRLSLTLRVSPDWRGEAWLLTVPRLGPAREGDAHARAITRWNVHGSILSLGLLWQVALSGVLVFLLDRRRLAYLWFGVQAMAASAYPLYTSGLSTALFGSAERFILGLGLVVALTVSLHSTHAFFSLGPVPRAFRWLSAATSLACVTVLLPGGWHDVAVGLVGAFVALCIGYQLLVIGSLWSRPASHRLTLGWLACAWGMLALAEACDFAYWFAAIDLLGGIRPASSGLAFFALFLSLLLGRAHVVSLARADELNAHLSDQIAEVANSKAELERSNAELRRQIAERSTQVMAALRLSGTGERSVPELLAGAVINGRYRVEGRLGAGAMGTVYRVVRLEDGTPWAMKVATGVHGSALARLAREAHILSQLHHPHVVQIIDLDIAHQGFLYVVIELVEGTTLRHWLTERGPMPLAFAVEQLGGVARGLAALHEAGIAHRDLKPENVLMAARQARWVSKITDFGISRLTYAAADDEDPVPLRPGAEGAAAAFGRTLEDWRVALRERSPSVPTHARIDGSSEDSGTSTAPVLPRAGDPFAERHAGGVARHAAEDSAEETAVERPPFRSDEVAGEALPIAVRGQKAPATRDTPGELSDTGALSGTPHYIAPELAWNGAPHDVRTDLYSFGVIAFEMLTGERPFRVPPALARIHHPERAPQRPRPLPREADALAPLVLRCLSFAPEERPTAEEVVRFLQALAPQPGSPEA